MSKELRDLLHKTQVRKYKESPPKKILYKIFSEVENKKHYGRMRSWDIMVELLAQWLLQNEDLTLASMVCKAFEGLPPPDKDLYQHINDLDLLKHYVVAAKQDPWDYIGEIYGEQGLVGPGQNMTPKAVVDMMIKMTFGGPPKQLKTQLDPCTGTGRFLFEASIMYPEAPLVLFGVEINLSLYRACLVNMALFSNHCYSIICADALRLDTKLSGPSSKLWDLGNRWDPPDISAFYWKPTPPFKRYMQMRKPK